MYFDNIIFVFKIIKMATKIIQYQQHYQGKQIELTILRKILLDTKTK